MISHSDLLSEFNKVQKLLIHTSSFDRIQTRLERALREAGTTATPSCMHIVGHSRTGKSFAARDFEARFPAVRAHNGLRKEVIYAQTPPSGTIKGLMEALLQALGDPQWMRGTYANMLYRLQKLLDVVQCRMIILDEFQHLVERGQKARLDRATDWLKSLVETSSFSLVAVGLPSSTRVIYYNEQLRNRFDATIEIPVYDWTDPSSQAHFRAVLNSFEQHLAPFRVPKLGSVAIGLRMFIACGGRIGLLAKILDRAVKDAIEANRLDIRLEDLDLAYKAAIWTSTYLNLEKGPFFAELNDRVTDMACKQSMALAERAPLEDEGTRPHLGCLPLAAEKPRATRKSHSHEMRRALG